jgi:hypothetical protein
MPRFLVSTEGAPAFAMKPWHPLPLQPRQYVLPIRGRDRDNDYWEVPMSRKGGDAAYNNPEGGLANDEFCYWTWGAAGGCTPFAVIVRDPARRERAVAIALAHLMFDPHVEARQMGAHFNNFRAAAVRDVHLVVMKRYDNMTRNHREELEYFRDFEIGFGAALPDQNKLVLTTRTADAGVNMDGYFGEISNAQTAALRGSDWVALAAASAPPTVWIRR